MDFGSFTIGITNWLDSNPLVMPIVLFLVFGLIAYRLKAYPAAVMIALFLLPAVLAVIVIAYPEARQLILWLNLGILGLAMFDLVIMQRPHHFSAERELLKVASLAKKHKVHILINNRSRRAARITIKDDLPQEFEADQTEFKTRLPGRSRFVIDYRFQPRVRGSFNLQFIFLRIRSPLGLWKKMLAIPVSNQVHVYPDMKQLSEYALLARTNRLSLLGLKRTRKIGQDNEFERLRDFTEDDNFKHIDWTSTARRNKLTVRDFQANQSQRIIFMMDCGRMMTNESHGLNMLDHSLNAILMLSYIALQRGDSVGLICFSEHVDRFVPARAGKGQMNHLLHAVFDRQARHVESRYDQAFVYLGTKCLQRSLVILVTNVIDDVNSKQVEKYLGTLVGRHLPVGVMLRDHSLFDPADLAPRTVSDVYRAAAAAEILTWRHQVITDLNHRGVLSLDVFPEDMTAPLINKYLEIKARHLL